MNLRSLHLSEEKNAERKRLYDKGLTDKQMAEELGIHKTTLVSWRNKHKLPLHPSRGNMLSDEDEALRRKLYRMGLSDGVIARKVGVAPITIYGWRHSRKLKPNFETSVSSAQRRQRCEQTKQILRLYKRKKSLNEIAETVGLPYQSVSVTVGHYLMRLCRTESSCPFKALLPETELKS